MPKFLYLDIKHRSGKKLQLIFAINRLKIAYRQEKYYFFYLKKINSYKK